MKTTAIDAQMTYSSTDVSSDVVTAYSYVTLYAQAAARQKLISEGVDVTSTDYLSTKGWYDAEIAQMLELGLTAKSMTSDTVKENTYSGTINLGDILNTILSAYFDPEEMAGYKALASLLSSDMNDVKTTNFLNFWWNHAHTDNKHTYLAFGPLKNDQAGQASVTAVYFALDVGFTDWRTLFMSFHSESLNVSSAALTLDLDMSVYNKPEIGPAIKAAIDHEISKHIQSTTLDFNS